MKYNEAGFERPVIFSTAQRVLTQTLYLKKIIIDRLEHSLNHEFHDQKPSGQLSFEIKRSALKNRKVAS